MAIQGPVDIRNAIDIGKMFVSDDPYNAIHALIFENRKDVEKGYKIKQVNGKNVAKLVGSYLKIPIHPTRLPHILIMCEDTDEHWIVKIPTESIEPPPMNRQVLHFTSDHAHHSKQCWECCKEMSLKACAQCKMAKYCSTECQQKNWQSHKHECKQYLNAIK